MMAGVSNYSEDGGEEGQLTVIPGFLVAQVVWNQDEQTWDNLRVSNDFTFALSPEHADVLFPESSEDTKPKASFSGQAICRINSPSGLKPLEIRGRILACRCRSLEQEDSDESQKQQTDRTAVSVTMRADEQHAKDAKKVVKEWLRDLASDGGEDTVEKLRTELNNNRFAPGNRLGHGWHIHVTRVIDRRNAVGSKKIERRSIKNAFLNSDFAGARTPPDDLPLPVSIDLTARLLHNQIFFRRTNERISERLLDTESMHGAVLISGRTKSAKSVITRALIHRYLSHRQTYLFLRDQHGRRPHLITCEDPIEKLFYKLDTNGEHPLQNLIDYTPRDRTANDYRSLREAFADALRQTPACMYIGEIRNQSDLREVINFAGTGHLVIATLHAGSLNDVFNKVFEAARVKNSAERGLVGSRILSAIHLKQLAFPQEMTPSKQQLVVTPTIWRRTVPSTAALVASGIGSLTPHISDDQHACLGRQYFAQQMCEMLPDLPETAKRAFLNVARTHDLRAE